MRFENLKLSNDLLSKQLLSFLVSKLANQSVRGVFSFSNVQGDVEQRREGLYLGSNSIFKETNRNDMLKLIF